MKKFIYILMLFMSLSIVTLAQETKEVKPSTIEEVERLIDKYSSQVIDATKPSATMLFQQAVKKEIVSSTVIIWIASIIIGIFILITTITYFKDESPYDVFFGWCIATIVVIIVGGIFIGCNICYLVTPEYYAAKDILFTFHNL